MAKILLTGYNGMLSAIHPAFVHAFATWDETAKGSCTAANVLPDERSRGELRP